MLDAEKPYLREKNNWNSTARRSGGAGYPTLFNSSMTRNKLLSLSPSLLEWLPNSSKNWNSFFKENLTWSARYQTGFGRAALGKKERTWEPTSNSSSAINHPPDTPPGAPLHVPWVCLGTQFECWHKYTDIGCLEGNTLRSFLYTSFLKPNCIKITIYLSQDNIRGCWK